MNPNEKPHLPIDAFPLLSSPSLSASHLDAAPPPPAYSALPYRDTDFDFAPVLQGKIGDVELETINGKRFLVHRKILESETVFFHI